LLFSNDLGSFDVLVFCRSFRENDDLYVEFAKKWKEKVLKPMQALH
jgi:hypothetical protein